MLQLYLATSPLGSLRISDFKPIHFLLKDGRVKLTDLDDVTSLEPSCDAVTSPKKPSPDGVIERISNVIVDTPLKVDFKHHRDTQDGMKGGVLLHPRAKMLSAEGAKVDNTQFNSRDANTDGAEPYRPPRDDSDPAAAGERTCGYNLRCVGGICQGFNALHNLAHMHKHFFRTLLSAGCEDQEDACARLRTRLDRLDINAEVLKELLYQIMRVSYVPGYT